MNNAIEDNNIKSWTPQIIKKLKDLKDKTWGYTWIHRENAGYLSDIYDMASILSYSLSFFNGVILIFPTNIVYIRIFNILLSFGSGLLGFYITNKDITRTVELHKMASSRFSSIYYNIDQQLDSLSFNMSDRENAFHYNKWISSQFDNLLSTAPDIDPPIIEEYIKKFARKKRSNPIEAAEFDKTSSNDDKKNTDDDDSYNTKSELQEIVVVAPPETPVNLSQAIIHDQDMHSISNGDTEMNELNKNPPDRPGVSPPDRPGVSPSAKMIESRRPSDDIKLSKILSEDSKSDLNIPLMKHKRKKSQKLYEYEVARYNSGVHDSFHHMNIGIGNKCLIPEYELK